MLTDEPKQRLRINPSNRAKVQLENAVFELSLNDSNPEVSVLPDWSTDSEATLAGNTSKSQQSSQAPILDISSEDCKRDSVSSVLSSVPVPPPRQVRAVGKRVLPQIPISEPAASTADHVFPINSVAPATENSSKGEEVQAALEVNTTRPQQDSRLDAQQPLYQLSTAIGSPMTVPPPFFHAQQFQNVQYSLEGAGSYPPMGQAVEYVGEQAVPLQYGNRPNSVIEASYDPNYGPNSTVYQYGAPEPFVGIDGTVFIPANNPYPGYMLQPPSGVSVPVGMRYPAPPMRSGALEPMPVLNGPPPMPISAPTPGVFSPPPMPMQPVVHVNSSMMTAEEVLAGNGSSPKQNAAASLANQSKKSAVNVSALPFQKSLELYRQNAKKSNDPAVQLDFAKYLIALAEAARNNEKDQRKAQELQESYVHEGVKLVKRLATQGGGLGKSCYPEAQFYLAECYGNGSLGLPIDHDKAFNLYVQASKQNHSAAAYRTAVCYEMGAGAKKDASRAAGFYRKAAKLGDTAAMYKLGMILLNGLLNQSRNVREGVSWLKRAAAQADSNCPHALHELGVLYENKTLESQNVVHQDVGYANELYSKAAQLGYPPSQYKMGQAYEYGQLNLPVDPRRSIAWYTRAAEQSDAEAELALSGWYLTGAEGILKQSDTEAYLWARKAADKGLAKAEYAVGYYSEHGIGVRMDIEEAKRWYIRSAGQSNKKALKRLKELKMVSGSSKPSKQKFHQPANDVQRRGEIDYGLNGQWRKEKDSDCSIM